MANIFLDFGANTGNGLSSFIQKFYMNKEWIIESFEPDLNILSLFREKFKDTELNIKSHHCAVWKHNGEVDFSTFTKNSEGSSVEYLMSKLYTSVYSETNVPSTRVVCRDICDIINQYNSDDSIYVKMDIEGSEFSVIRRLLEDESACKKIKEMFIEWHTPWLKDETEETKLLLINKLTSYNIGIHNWG